MSYCCMIDRYFQKCPWCGGKTEKNKKEDDEWITTKIICTDCKRVVYCSIQPKEGVIER